MSLLISFILNYKKQFIFASLFIFAFISGMYVSYIYKDRQFIKYKQEQQIKYDNEISNLIKEQKKQSDKDLVIVQNLDLKLNQMSKDNEDKKNQLEALLDSKQNISVMKECKLDNQSLNVINSIILNKK